MTNSLEFLVGLLDCAHNAFVTRDVLDGPHSKALQEWQDHGFIEREADVNPVPTCPHCEEGVPARLGDQHLCPRCHSTVEAAWLRAWPVRTERFLTWLAEQFSLRGGVRRIDDPLWQLGTFAGRDGEIWECFFRQRGSLSNAGQTRLQTYRRVLLLSGLMSPGSANGPIRCVSLLDILPTDGSLTVLDLSRVLQGRGVVRFEAHSGALYMGDRWMGEVSHGSKEFFLLARLAEELDHFVPYADLKRAVLRQSGSADETEEATFCQGLKSRLKKKWIPHIDRLIATTNKADGYRLRGYVELPE